MIIVTTVDYFDSKAEKANRNELRFCIDDTEESAKCIAAVQKKSWLFLVLEGSAKNSDSSGGRQVWVWDIEKKFACSRN